MSPPHLKKLAWISDDALAARAQPPAQTADPPRYAPPESQMAALRARPVMAPAAQEYYANSLVRGSANLRKAKELEYGGPQQLAKVMQVASRYGSGSADPNTLNVDVPVKHRASAGHGSYVGDLYGRGGTMYVNSTLPANRKNPYDFLDTVGHELTHAADTARGALTAGTALKDYLVPSVPEAARNKGSWIDSRYDSAAHELRAGPIHAMKAYMVNKTGKIPTNTGEASKQIRDFRKEFPDPTESFPVRYPKSYWEGLYRNKDATPVLYLQTVKAPDQLPRTPGLSNPYGAPQAPGAKLDAARLNAPPATQPYMRAPSPPATNASPAPIKMASVERFQELETPAIVSGARARSTGSITASTGDEGAMDGARKSLILQKLAMEDVSVRRGMGWGQLAKNLQYEGGWKKLRDDVVARGGSQTLHPGQVYGYDPAGGVLMRSGPRMSSRMREYAGTSAPAAPAVVAAPTKPAPTSAVAAPSNPVAARRTHEIATMQGVNEALGNPVHYGLRRKVDYRGAPGQKYLPPTNLGEQAVSIPRPGSYTLGGGATNEATLTTPSVVTAPPR